MPNPNELERDKMKLVVKKTINHPGNPRYYWTIEDKDGNEVLYWHVTFTTEEEAIKDFGERFRAMKEAYENF